MTDFIHRGDRPTVNFYPRIAEACSKAHLMIMFHGAYPPKGLNRTYLNNVTREGVLGSEYNAWSDKVTASHNCIIPFTRMLPVRWIMTRLDRQCHYVTIQTHLGQSDEPDYTLRATRNVY